MEYTPSKNRHLDKLKNKNTLKQHSYSLYMTQSKTAHNLYSLHHSISSSKLPTIRNTNI